MPEQMVLRTGDETTIRLPGLGSAGYEWSVTVDDGGSVSVEEVEVAREGPPGPAGSTPPGSSRDQVFRLAAVRIGEALVRFEQRRPWEGDVAPHDTRAFRVVVRP